MRLGSRQSFSLLIQDRTRECDEQASEHTDTRHYDFQAKDSDDFPSSLSPGNRLFNFHPYLTKCVRRGSGVSETQVCFLEDEN